MRRTNARFPELENEGMYRVFEIMLSEVAKKDYTAWEGRGFFFALCPQFVVSDLRGTSEDLRSGRGWLGRRYRWRDGVGYSGRKER